MDQRLDEDTLAVRYLLGDLPEEERVRLEEEFFVDDHLFERFLAVKDELTDAYARDELTGRERKLFEKHFLATAPRRQRADEAKELIGVASAITSAEERQSAIPQRSASSSWWQVLHGSLRGRSPVLQFSLAALLLATVFGGSWMLIKRLRPWSPQLEGTETNVSVSDRQREQERESKQDAERRPAVPPSVAEPDREAARSGVNDRVDPTEDTQLARTNPPAASSPAPARTPIKRPQQSSPAKTQVATLMLMPVLARDVDQSNILLLSPETAAVRLHLAFKGEGYSSYGAAISTVNGVQQVWSQRSLKARLTPAGKIVTLNLRPALFRARDYIVTLSGVETDGRAEEINEYYFKVDRNETSAPLP